jgi:hypothetical protein
MAGISDRIRNLADYSDPVGYLSQCEHPCIGGDFAAAEIGSHPFPGNPFELKRKFTTFSHGRLNSLVLCLIVGINLTTI